MIGDRIRKERKCLKLSREKFLEAIGWQPTSTKMLSSWEKGEKLPDVQSLAKMAELFSCDIGYLLGDYDERTRDAADLCELTGLSERAANTLLGFKESRLREIVFLLESANFENAIGYLAEYWDAKELQLGLLEIRRKRIVTQGSGYTTDIQLKDAISRYTDSSNLNDYLVMKHLGFLTKEIERIEAERIENNG